MTDTVLGHMAFLGVTVDHLYRDCPACPKPPRRAVGLVNPEGTDICGLCRQRWERKQT